MQRVEDMRIRRGLLFWGLVLIPLGAIPLLVRAGTLPDDLIADIWRWWPILLIGLGIALLLGRSKAGLIGTAVVALVLGTLGGSALASGGWTFGSIAGCVGPASDPSILDADGTFAGGASVSIDLDCGTVNLATEPGDAWRVHAEYVGEEPRIDSSGGGLAVRTPDVTGLHRQDWTVTVGADALRDLDIEMNAGSASAILAGASLSRLTTEMNAGDLIIDGTGATMDRVEASLNAGRLRITLASAARGDLSANAGAIELCVPPDADLRFEVEEQLTFATNLDDRGLSQSGETWTRPGSGPSIDLSIEGNAASFTLDPEGGCK